MYGGVSGMKEFDPDNRSEYGYTVDDVAEAAGLSRARIYQIVNEAEGLGGGA
jgi:plasmid maintenance system antidote protein VapI